MRKRKQNLLDPVKKIAFTAIEQQLHELHGVGEDIWRLNESAGQEHKSHDVIVAFLKRKGFKVFEKYHGFETSFRAEFGEGEVGGSSHPNIGLLCVYDADQSRGHIYGHNLVTVVALIAALGLQTVIKFASQPLGKVTVIGCPGGEDNRKKIAMFEAECFKRLDFVLCAYPSHYTNVCPEFVGAKTRTVTFRGRARDDKGRPWEAANPVNAVVLAYQNVSALRQQFNPDWAVKGVITSAGTQANQQPERASMEFLMKAPKPSELKVLGEKMNECFGAAATATGCTCEVEDTKAEYSCSVPCARLTKLYETNARLNGFTFHNRRTDRENADDISILSTSIPTLKVFYYSGSPAELGTDEFNRYVGSKDSQFMCVVQGKTLAMMALDLMTSDENMKQVFEEHHNYISEYFSEDKI